MPVKWEFVLRAESMGPGSEKVLGTVVGSTNAGQLKYGTGYPAPVPTINVAAGDLPPGVYKLRLIVVDNTGNYPLPCEVRVIVEH